MKKLVWTALVVGLLAAAIVSTQYKQALNCTKISVAMDANNDEQFTYHDVGSVALQAIVLPLKFVRQRDELKPLIVFFELKPNECATPKAIILSGLLLLFFSLAGAWLISVTFFGLRYMMKYLLFDALKVSPSGRWNAILLRYSYPRFVWLLPPRHVVFLCCGLTAILLLKIGSQTTSVKQKPQSRIPASDAGDRQGSGASDRVVKEVANPQPSLQFVRELTLAINAIRKDGCNSKPPAPLLLDQQGLRDTTLRIHSGSDIKTAEVEAGYRSVSSQMFQLSGHRSVASIQGVLRDKYCDTVLNPNLTALGVAGTLSRVTIVLAKPFVSNIANPATTVKEVVSLVNAARATGGRCGPDTYPSSTPLLVNEKLQAAAQAHATDMAERNYYDHQSLDGRSPSARMKSAGYGSRMTAENIAAGQQTATEVVAGWLKSPGHCRNILMPEFREIGVGVDIKLASEKGIYWVQKFGAGER
jgi:uncharacterized protein YkwD